MLQFNFSDLLLMVIEKEEIPEFFTWAFGRDYNSIEDGSELLDAWNTLHPSHILNGEGLITHDLKKMLNLWKESR